MPAQQPIPEGGTTLARVDHIAEGALVALLVALPFWVGGVTATAHAVVVSAALVVALCNLVRAARGPGDHGVGWAVWWAAGFAALVGVQLLPVPMGGLEVLSPRAAALWAEAFTAIPDGASAGWAPLSVHPHATRRDLRLLLAGVVLLAAACRFSVEPARRRRLLAVMVATGVAVAALGVVQNATGAERIYWSIESPRARADGGPFVHRGHFSAFVNLAIGAAFALLLRRRVAQRAGAAMTRIDAALLGGALLGVLGVVLSTSRAGLLAMLLAGAGLAAVLQRTGRLPGAGWLWSGLLAAAMLTAWVLGIEPLQERLTRLDLASEYSPRLALLADAVRMALAFPWGGAGLGAFEVAFPQFDRSTRVGTAAHAENLWVELWAETGAAGLVVVAVFIVLVGARLTRVARNPATAGERVADLGLGFGLLAVAIHSCFDFGLRVPAVAVLMLVAVALVLGGSAAARQPSRVAAVTLHLALLGALVWAVPSAWAAARADRHWRQAEAARQALRGPDELGAPEDYVHLLAHARRAVELGPTNARYQLWTALHEWHRVLSREIGYDPAAAVAGAPPPAQRTPRLESAAQQAQLVIRRALALAPSYGPLWSAAGQLGVVWLNDAAGAAWIHRGRALYPHHPAVVLASARQLLNEARDADAIPALRRALRLGVAWERVIDGLLQARPDLVLAVVRDDPHWLVLLEQRLQGQPEHQALLDAVRATALPLLRDRCAAPAAPSWMFAGAARYAMLAGDDVAAERFYADYLQREPQSKLRLDYAEVLLRLGEIERARSALHRLLRLHPNHVAAKARLTELGQ